MLFFLHLNIFFLYIHSPLLGGKLKIVVTVILSKLDHRPLFNEIYYKTILMRELILILLTNATHCLYTMVVINRYVCSIIVLLRVKQSSGNYV